MPNFVSAQYVANEVPPPDQLIRAVADDGTVWWLDDNCTQGDWLRFKQEGGTVEAAAAKPVIPPEEPS
jgi:hypothetical protein